MQYLARTGEDTVSSPQTPMLAETGMAQSGRFLEYMIMDRMMLVLILVRKLLRVLVFEVRGTDLKQRT